MEVEDLTGRYESAVSAVDVSFINAILDVYGLYREARESGAWEAARKQLDLLKKQLTTMEREDTWKSDEDRDRFLSSVRLSIDEERAWIIAQEPQALGTGVVGDVPPAERRVVKLTMNQAVVADLRQLSFYSDNFSSCSPVAMYNEDTHRGGLFHFPGSGLSSGSAAETRGRLAQMYGDVKPTVVWLNSRFRAPTAWDPWGQPSDVEPISKYLRGDLGYTKEIRMIAEASWAYSFYEDGAGPRVVVGSIPETGASISAEKDRTTDERSELAARWEGLPKAMKYGVDEFSDLAR